MFVPERGAFMPTQEERLSALEQTVAVLNRGIWDINHNETILLGMAVKQGENIQGMMASLATLNEHFSIQDGRIDTLDGRIDTLDGHIETLDGRIDTLDGHIETLDGRLGAFEQNVNNRFETLEGRFGTLEQSVDSRFEGQDKKLDQIVLLLNTLISKPGERTE